MVNLGYMRASRLLSILILLQLRGRLTADRLAEEFGTSVRTIYRDIDALSAAGFPIYSDRGPGGGFQLIDGYRSHLTGLALDEAEAMFMIGMPGPATALGIGPAAVQAGQKLLASLPATWSQQAARIRARFHLDPVDWYRTAEPLAHLPALARAVLHQRVVSMRYDSWSGIREWTVEPLGLVLKAGAWYLVARSGNKTSMFKVSNILSQTVQDAIFERPDDFDLAQYWSKALVQFENDLRPSHARLRASALGRKRLSALGTYAVNAISAAEMLDKDGWSQLSFPIENIDHAALLLLAIGPEIEVLEPAMLQARLRELAEQIVMRNL